MKAKKCCMNCMYNHIRISFINGFVQIWEPLCSFYLRTSRQSKKYSVSVHEFNKTQHISLVSLDERVCKMRDTRDMSDFLCRFHSYGATSVQYVINGVPADQFFITYESNGDEKRLIKLSLLFAKKGGFETLRRLMGGG